jgi:hypothetical protein
MGIPGFAARCTRRALPVLAAGIPGVALIRTADLSALTGVAVAAALLSLASRLFPFARGTGSIPHILLPGLTALALGLISLRVALIVCHEHSPWWRRGQAEE